ncbi:L-ascorbate metabolism protein UlaG, beta-lactamase superfamily [Chitinophaga jiangningensis]|uniref:L-ascorbate metabolism protein UlaG, beta-lactamase superfamily n=1 Tax=Chitinophaga jiangningensis TaxID=1419482 RepID=A0A1M6XU13_9BACT|nr:MBL fold metallo-hydrolase [Chitinophaga jiangningensis]SHL09482.1 L-ascorbate metabolism protein UlaG, beta-lactamase superfamily [Chitinophaga jiangningensis]
MITITHIDTACVLIDIAGYKILTDPTLDAPGKLYYHGSGGFSRKTSVPAAAVSAADIDLVLLSHHQHKDNFDREGRKLAEQVPLVLSTRAAAKTLPNAKGLQPWETFSIEDQHLKITATPAQHHPWWVPEFLAGEVIGFVIESPLLSQGALYISGDTVYFKGLREIGQRFKIDIGIFHVGAVQFRYLTGWGKYTLNSRDLLKTIHELNPARVIPVHFSGWTHFKEKEPVLRKSLQQDAAVWEKTIFPEPGIAISL